MIKSMYDLGIPLETIAKASKLSLHEIEHILGHNNDKSVKEHHLHYVLLRFLV